MLPILDGRRVQVVRLRREVAQKPRLGTRDCLRTVSRSFRTSEEVPFFLAAVPAHLKPHLLRVAGKQTALIYIGKEDDTLYDS